MRIFTQRGMTSTILMTTRVMTSGGLVRLRCGAFVSSDPAARSEPPLLVAVEPLRVPEPPPPGSVDPDATVGGVLTFFGVAVFAVDPLPLPDEPLPGEELGIAFLPGGLVGFLAFGFGAFVVFVVFVLAVFVVPVLDVVVGVFVVPGALVEGGDVGVPDPPAAGVVLFADAADVVVGPPVTVTAGPPTLGGVVAFAAGAAAPT